MARRRNPLGKRFDVPKTKGLVLARLGQKGKRVHIVNPKTGRTLCEPENPDLYASQAQVADCYRCLKLIDLNQQNRGSILSVPTRGNPLRANTIFERQFIPSHEGAIYDSSGSPYRQQHSMIVGGRQGTWIGKKKKKTKGAKPSSPFTSKLADGDTPPKARTQSKKTRAYLERQKAAHDEGRSTGLEGAIEHLIEEAKLKAMAREDMPLETRQGLILYFVEGWPVSDQPGAEERLKEEMRKHPAQFQALRSTTKGFRAKRRAPYGSRKRKLPRLKTNPPKPKERTMARRSHKKNPVHHLSRRELVLLAQMETARMGRRVTMDDLLETGPGSMFKGRIKLKGGKRKSAANPSRRRNSEKLTAAEQRELEKAFGKTAKLGKKQKRGTVREDVYSYYGARPSYATPIRSRFVVNKKAKKVRYCRADGKTIWCTPKQARAYRRNRG